MALVQKPHVSVNPVVSESLQRQLVARVGQTPLVKISKLAAKVAPVEILAKTEWTNPGGSVKDRAALNIIMQAEKRGDLTPEKTLLDASSGNTAIAYAMFGALLGYRVKLAVPRNAGTAFKQILGAYGADLVLTDAAEGSDGAIREVRRIYDTDPQRYFYADQYNNKDNWGAHYYGTGVEIIEQTGGDLTHFVAGLGTSGTFTGVGRRLKTFDESIRLISVQPDSPFHGLEGLKRMSDAIVPGIYEPELADRNVEVRTEEAQDMVKRLAREEGLLVGLSAGAAMVAALNAARELSHGRIVVVFPDSGHKYLDQRFWEMENGAKN